MKKIIVYTETMVVTGLMIGSSLGPITNMAITAITKSSDHPICGI